MASRDLKSKRKSLTQSEDVEELQRAMDKYIAKNPSHNCELQIKITGQIKKRLQSGGKKYKGTIKEQAAREHQPDIRVVFKQVTENGHIVRPRKKNRLKRELPEPIDFLTVHGSQSQSTDSSQSPVIKRERRTLSPIKRNNTEVINLDSSDSDDHSFDFGESTSIGVTQPGDDIPFDSIITGNIFTRAASAEPSPDPNEPSTSTQILAPKTARKSRSVAQIFNDSSSEDEAEKTIKNEPSYSPLSQSMLKNESEDDDENDPNNLSNTCHSQNLFETSLNTHFSDENYPTRYR